jgi:hypothetical protein
MFSGSILEILISISFLCSDHQANSLFILTMLINSYLRFLLLESYLMVPVARVLSDSSCPFAMTSNTEIKDTITSCHSKGTRLMLLVPF